MHKHCAAGCSRWSASNPGLAYLPQMPRCLRGSAAPAPCCRGWRKTIKTAQAIWPPAAGCWPYSCVGIYDAGIAQHRIFQANLVQRFCLKCDRAPAVGQKILLGVQPAEERLRLDPMGDFGEISVGLKLDN